MDLCLFYEIKSNKVLLIQLLKEYLVPYLNLILTYLMIINLQLIEIHFKVKSSRRLKRFHKSKLGANQ
ncbi:hypothetical protein LV83_01625 [Algoriphagus yeomjeoni]|uniref:Uncharacterized protein n=1 Tax=Algoriphagus yeomjeoni TaxID=291403 RepID=A0A327PGJ7_9BACT|nr:hypothetical protein LV83_01625 [Algoriphagus yeomjeoni]